MEGNNGLRVCANHSVPTRVQGTSMGMDYLNLPQPPFSIDLILQQFFSSTHYDIQFRR